MGSGAGGEFLFGAPHTMGVPESDGHAERFVRSLDLGKGLGKQLGQLTGPFVLAAVDAETGDTILARDRLGRSRLFYHVGPEGVRCSPSLLELAREVGPPGLSTIGLSEILAFRWSMGWETYLHGIQQVQAGTILRISPQGEEKKEHFWTLPLSPSADSGTFESWVDRAEEGLRAGLTSILETAEKPFLLLSGGVDSAIQAALASRIRPDVVAVTPEWGEETSPELPRARAVAEHLGLEHRVTFMADADLLRFVPETVAHFGGPLRDYHMVVLAWVYDRMASEGFDLVLHGQAADTLFGPGNIHFLQEFGRKRQWLDLFPSRVLEWLGSLLPGGRDLGDRWERMEALLSWDRDTALLRRHRLLHRKSFRKAASRWLASRGPAQGVLERPASQVSEAVRVQTLDLYQGTVSHMVTSSAISAPTGITMGYPYLTDPVLAVARALPDVYKNRGGEAKPVLKDLGARFFPREWMQAPKLGFPTPKRTWMSGALAPWIEERLGTGSFSRTILGDAVVDRLALPADYELIWTLASLEEALALAFPGADRGEIPVLEP